MTESRESIEKASDTSLTEILAAASRIEGVDVELALSRISGRQSVLEECIKQTADSIGEQLKRMSIHLSKGELREFSVEAHGLKVALAGIGASGHSKIASELEMLSKAEKETDCKKKFIGFAALLKKLASELRLLLPRETREVKKAGDRVLLSEVVSETSEALSLFETDDALVSMGRLDGFTFGDENDILLETVKNKIKKYKYDEAMVLLGKISETREIDILCEDGKIKKNSGSVGFN